MHFATPNVKFPLDIDHFNKTIFAIKRSIRKKKSNALWTTGNECRASGNTFPAFWIIHTQKNTKRTIRTPFIRKSKHKNCAELNRAFDFKQQLFEINERIETIRFFATGNINIEYSRNRAKRAHWHVPNNGGTKHKRSEWKKKTKRWPHIQVKMANATMKNRWSAFVEPEASPLTSVALLCFRSPNAHNGSIVEFSIMLFTRLLIQPNILPFLPFFAIFAIFCHYCQFCYFCRFCQHLTRFVPLAQRMNWMQTILPFGHLDLFRSTGIHEITAIAPYKNVCNVYSKPHAIETVQTKSNEIIGNWSLCDALVWGRCQPHHSMRNVRMWKYAQNKQNISNAFDRIPVPNNHKTWLVITESLKTELNEIYSIYFDVNGFVVGKYMSTITHSMLTVSNTACDRHDIQKLPIRLLLRWKSELVRWKFYIYHKLVIESSSTNSQPTTTITRQYLQQSQQQQVRQTSKLLETTPPTATTSS